MIAWWRDQPARLLFTWARWLALRHPTIRFTNLYVVVFSVLGWMAFNYFVPSFNVAADSGLVQQANGLLQGLAGFFIAALALVSGFPGDALDRPMGAVQPYFMIGAVRVNPTRRELLGYLFAYLVGITVILYFVGALAVAALHPHPQPFMVWLRTAGEGWVGVILKALYVGALLHMLAVTLLGLNFLGNFLSGSVLSRGSAPSGPPTCG